MHLHDADSGRQIRLRPHDHKYYLPAAIMNMHRNLPSQSKGNNLSPSSSSATSSIIFFLPWERVNRPFIGCHHANFPARTLGFLELFSNCPVSIIGHISQGAASHLDITRTIWSQWTGAWWPPRVSLVLTAFGCLSRCPGSCLTIPRTIWFEWTQSGQPPLACCKISFECLFRTVHVYYFFIVCICHIYAFELDLILFLSVQPNIQFKCLF